MKENYDIEIEKTLESLDSMDRADPKPFLFGRIKTRLERKREVSFLVHWKYQLLSGLLIILLNTVFFFSTFQESQNFTEEEEYLVEEYGFTSFSYDLIEE